mmetsp:Transcript_18858/g.71881  ORF Transcript_18858/g.71881 Transcript_18858/m.71881 type:complete len:578 (+) Transcript_18858:681-2414(+)
MVAAQGAQAGLAALGVGVLAVQNAELLAALRGLVGEAAALLGVGERVHERQGRRLAHDVGPRREVAALPRAVHAQHAAGDLGGPRLEDAHLVEPLAGRHPALELVGEAGLLHDSEHAGGQARHEAALAHAEDAHGADGACPERGHRLPGEEAQLRLPGQLGEGRPRVREGAPDLLLDGLQAVPDPASALGLLALREVVQLQGVEEVERLLRHQHGLARLAGVDAGREDDVRLGLLAQGLLGLVVDALKRGGHLDVAQHAVAGPGAVPLVAHGGVPVAARVKLAPHAEALVRHGHDGADEVGVALGVGHVGGLVSAALVVAALAVLVGVEVDGVQHLECEAVAVRVDARRVQGVGRVGRAFRCVGVRVNGDASVARGGDSRGRVRHARRPGVVQHHGRGVGGGLEAGRRGGGEDEERRRVAEHGCAQEGGTKSGAAGDGAASGRHLRGERRGLAGPQAGDELEQVGGQVGGGRAVEVAAEGGDHLHHGALRGPLAQGAGEVPLELVQREREDLVGDGGHAEVLGVLGAAGGAAKLPEAGHLRGGADGEAAEAERGQLADGQLLVLAAGGGGAGAHVGH